MATLYFNGAVDNEWTTLGNWWTDSGFTTQATSLPTSADDVIATASISSNSGSAPTVVNFTLNDPSENFYFLGIAITVTGNANFNEYSYNDGTVNGDATFNDSSVNYGAIGGNATFNDSSFAHPLGLYYGTVTFQNRTLYPLKRGVNSSSLLAIV